MKNTVDKLYSFITKLVLLLEEELEEIEMNKSKSALIIKRNLTDTLHKLVNLIIRLNKLSQENIEEDYIMGKEDEEIIKHFIEKYNS